MHTLGDSCQVCDGPARTIRLPAELADLSFRACPRCTPFRLFALLASGLRGELVRALHTHTEPAVRMLAFLILAEQDGLTIHGENGR